MGTTAEWQEGGRAQLFCLFPDMITSVVLVIQLRPTLYHPMDHRPLGSSIHGIL